MQFKKDFSKSYNSPQEEDYRKNIFKENLKELDIEKTKIHDKDLELGVTQFYDLSN